MSIIILHIEAHDFNYDLHSQKKKKTKKTVAKLEWQEWLTSVVVSTNALVWPIVQPRLLIFVL